MLTPATMLFAVALSVSVCAGCDRATELAAGDDLHGVRLSPTSTGSAVRPDEMPDGVEAAWPSIETDKSWVEYDILADSFAEAKEQCRTRGESGWAGFTEWNLSWHYTFSDYTYDVRVVGDRQTLAVRDLELTVTSVKVSQATYLPRLEYGEGFSDEDKRAWKLWYRDLRGHEVAHQRISSTARIGEWMKRRVSKIRYLEGTFPADLELTDDHAKQVIRAELSEIHGHAESRIQDKNTELDQRTAHGPVELDWDEFFTGYF